MSKIGCAIGTLKLAAHANSPKMLIIGGVITMGASVVVACKQTMQFDDTLEPYVKQLEKIEGHRSEKSLMTGNRVYDEDVAQSDRYKTYCQVAVSMGKLYFVPIVLFVGGSAMVFKGHSIMAQRNAVLAVAFTTLKKSFDSYRARVVDEQGEMADQRFLNGSKTITMTDSMGSYIAPSRDWEESEKDLYNRVFSRENSHEWKNDLGSNKTFIAGRQKYAQELLNRKGYVYLSEVYDGLGFPESDVSRVVGWKITTLPDGTRNVPFVDFGLDKALPDDWKYSKERAIFLDFNCQGLIIGGKIRQALEQA